MTIDSTGRAHKPAGSPASSGGQFAQQAAPAASAQLDTSRDIASERLTEAGKDYQDAAHRYRTAAAGFLADRMRANGLESIRFSMYHDSDGHHAAHDDPEVETWLGEIGGDEVNELADSAEYLEPNGDFQLDLDTIDRLATPQRRPYGDRVAARRRAMARYADESRAELAEKLHAVWPDAHQLGLSTRGDDDWGTHEWGATRYQLESIHRADGSVITRGGDDDMWELIEHRTGHSQDELRDLLDDIGESDAILGAAGPREHLVLGETLEFG